MRAAGTASSGKLLRPLISASESSNARKLASLGISMAYRVLPAPGSGMPPILSGAPLSVSNWASIAANFSGWLWARNLALRSPETICNGVATAPTASPRTNAFRTYLDRSPRSIARAYTPATAKPATTYEAIVPWATSYGIAGLNIAAHGSTFTALPPATSKPRGWFIQAFVLMTKSAEAAELTTRGTVHSQCATGERRSQPYRYSARKIASVKNAKPSRANGMPMILPEKSIHVDQSRPNSKERIVPETAPTAKRTPATRPQP